MPGWNVYFAFVTKSLSKFAFIDSPILAWKLAVHNNYDCDVKGCIFIICWNINAVCFYVALLFEPICFVTNHVYHQTKELNNYVYVSYNFINFFEKILKYSYNYFAFTRNLLFYKLLTKTVLIDEL